MDDADVDSLLLSLLQLDSLAPAADWLVAARSDEDVRLKACLIVDVKALTLSPDLVRGVIEAAVRKGAASALGLVQVLDGHLPQSAVCCGGLIHGFESPAAHARVMAWTTFKRWVLQPLLGISPLGFYDDRDAKAYYRKGARISVNAGDRLAGGRDRAWICSAAEIAPFMVAGDACTLLNDRLGIGFPVGTEVVVFQYPALPLPSNQPTALDAAWDRDNFYLSHKSASGWGRTASCSRPVLGLDERVHRGWTVPVDSEISVLAVGSVRSLATDRPGLLREGLRRATDG